MNRKLISRLEGKSLAHFTAQEYGTIMETGIYGQVASERSKVRQRCATDGS